MRCIPRSPPFPPCWTSQAHADGVTDTAGGVPTAGGGRRGKAVHRKRGTNFCKPRKTAERACRHCPFTTQYPSALERHERVHTGEKPYGCAHCPFRSTQKCHAVRHEAQHAARAAAEAEMAAVLRTVKEHVDADKRVRAGSVASAGHKRSRPGEGDDPCPEPPLPAHTTGEGPSR